MPRSALNVLSEIFSAETGYGGVDVDLIETSPSYADLMAFADLITKNPREELLQKFVECRPQFLMGLYGWGDDSILSFHTKPTIGSRFRADFGLLQYGQGGCCIHLVELEPLTDRLFTKRGDRARRHNSALTQCRDWVSWIHPNKVTFVRDMVENVRAFPKYPNRSGNGSFRRREFSEIEAAWRGFGGFEDPEIKCTVVIGRWSQMTEAERKNLISQNRHDDKLAKVITYEQLARSSFERAFRIY